MGRHWDDDETAPPVHGGLQETGGFAAVDPDYFDFIWNTVVRGGSLIRLRDKATGAEAKWDRGDWSGDADLVSLLRVWMRIFHIRSHCHDTFGAMQARMAESFPAYGVEVMRTTQPEEIPHDPDVVY